MMSPAVATPIVALICFVRCGLRLESDFWSQKAETYRVYSACLNYDVRGEYLLVLQNRTTAKTLSCDWETLSRRLPPLKRSTFVDFCVRNLWRRRLEPLLSVSAPYRLASAHELGLPAEQFNQRFPNNLGYVSVSAVGFSSEMDQALIYIDNWRCGLCGGGGWILLKKRSGTWDFEAEYQVWAS
jgi:hypothetical protein